MLGALLYVKAIRFRLVAVAATGAAGPVVMDLELDPTKWALTLDD